MKRTDLLAVAMAVIAGANISQADDQSDALPVVAPKVKSLAAFKNGLAFVFKSAETPLKNGWARMDQLPPAALGTLWIGTTSKTGPVTDVIAYKEKTTIDADSVSLAELLAANVGGQVSITYLAGSNAKTADGVLLSVPKARQPDDNEIAPSGQPDFRGGWRPAPEMAQPEIVLLRSKNAGNPVLLALNLSSIQSVEIAGDASLRTKIERELARTKIHVASQPSHAEITLACLEKGIVWSPSYRINLADDKNASIELESILADDQEDLDNADVSFVVGYPNFLFADILSPISLQQSVAAFLQALMSGGSDRNRGGMFANVMAQSAAYNNFRSDTGGAPDAGYSVAAPLPGEQNEDLYLYRKSGVTLKKGDRARFSILSITAPYEHLYQWDVADTMNSDEHGYRNNNERPKPEDLVWHVLRLKNTGKQPWTTAPAFAVNDTLPVAQDTLTYTPPGGRSILKLTIATDVHAEQNQIETARRQITVTGRDYDEVTVSGKLRLTNWKSKEIAMDVHKSLVGEVLESPDGKMAKAARNLTSVNSTSEIEWEFKLTAGQNRELTYQYKVLLNR